VAVRFVRRVLVPVLSGLMCAACIRAEPAPGVAPSIETQPVRSTGDAADDPAVWVHPTDPALSTVIGTDRRGGLGVWDLEGREVQFADDAPADNVDLRTIVLDGVPRSLVVSSGWDDRVLHLYLVDVPTRRLRPAGIVRTGVAAAGLCLYRNAASGTVYAFVMDEGGAVEQWELSGGPGGVHGRLVRGPWEVGGETEGCVADDERGQLYVGEEERGVWRYGAEPDRPVSERVLAANAGRSSRLRPDVEGLALFSASDGTGLLLVSSQGDSSFAVYRREGSDEFVGTFRVVPGVLDPVTRQRPDGCEDTDGIDVVTVPLGTHFPNGMFVCQDGHNGELRQNFKLVPLERITAVIGASVR
jgi:3-phytase